MYILKQEPGLIQYSASQGDGENIDSKRFQIPFYIYDISSVSVYLTPTGTLPNDAANLLTYDTDYFGATYLDPTQHDNYYGYIALFPASFPNYTNEGDIVTIFYDYGAATIVPQYPYCSTAIRGSDSILPALPANHIWIKSSDGNSIQTVTLPGSPTLGTTANAALKTDGNGSMLNSNTLLSPVKIGQTYYDNISGVRNINISGALISTQSGTSSYGSDADVFGTIKATTVEARNAVYIYHDGVNSDNSTGYKTVFNSSRNTTNDIVYQLPQNQAVSDGSFLASDALGNLSWLSQDNINKLGTINTGKWNAQDIYSHGNIAASGYIKAGLDGDGIFPGTVYTSSLAINDQSYPEKTTKIIAPENFTDNYQYILPQTMGDAGDVLTIQSASNNDATLSWGKSNIKHAWVRFHIEVAPDNISYVVVMTDSVNATVTRLAIGIYEINFAEGFFTSAQSYAWQATGYEAKYETHDLGIGKIVQTHSSWPAGEDPTATHCRFAIYGNNGILIDPYVLLVPPQIAPDVCITFIGT
jgi:hypothetical protein